MILQEYDVVRVVKLLDLNRSFEGSDEVMRPPALGDIAMIVYEYDLDYPGANVVAESGDEDGYTIWLADFQKQELEFVERPVGA